MKVGRTSTKGRTYGDRTRAIHGKNIASSWEYGHNLNPPITRSNAFRLDSTARGAEAFRRFADPHFEGVTPEFFYERFHGACKGMLQDQIADMEHGAASRVLATGMGAIHTGIVSVMGPGNSIIADPVIYGCSYDSFSTLYKDFSWPVHFVDTSDLEAVRRTITKDTRVIYLETPGNPNLKLTDIRALRQLVDEINAHRRPQDRIIIIVDNTFATPYAQRPLDLGADMSILSLTKGINGFSSRMGGAVTVRDARRFLPRLDRTLKNIGAVMLDEVAWDFLVYSLPTLSMRLSLKTENTKAIASYLEANPMVGSGNVFYPGLESFPQFALAQAQLSTGLSGEFSPGDMIYFQLAPRLGEKTVLHLRRTRKFLDYLAQHSYCWTLAVSLGLMKSLLESPPLMTHSALTPEQMAEAKILPAGIRVSVGAEEVNDLVYDMDKAFERAK